VINTIFGFSPSGPVRWPGALGLNSGSVFLYCNIYFIGRAGAGKLNVWWDSNCT